MSKQIEALKMALECVEAWDRGCDRDLYWRDIEAAITAIREALAEQTAQEPCIKCKGLGYYDEGHECYDGSMAGGNYVECDKCKQPDFIKHEVENTYDWSEWVCPDPESYLMKCCDCGLVHEAQFRVAKYKPAPSDECEVVSDPDLQAQFRMRRSEQWSPADTAHRPGGLPMAEQPAQQEPFGYFRYDLRLDAWVQNREGRPGTPFYTSPLASKPLTDEQIIQLAQEWPAETNDWASHIDFARAIEAAHGIKERNT